MQELEFKDYIDKKELQKLQDQFAHVTGCSVFCVDKSGQPLTILSGNAVPEEVQSAEYQSAINTAFERVEEGSLEDMAIETVENIGVRVAAVAVRHDDSTFIYWMVIEEQPDKDEERFDEAIDLLRDTSFLFISIYMSGYTAEVESRKNQSAKEEMGKDLERIESTTSIVQLLDLDDPIEGIIEKWLDILSVYLQVDTSQVFRINPQENTMDVICEWKAPGCIPYFDQTAGLPIYPFLRVNKPLVINGDGSYSEFRKNLDEIGLKAVMVFPILQSDPGYGMVLCLNHRNRSHNFNMAEIKFAADAIKILQSIITKRIQKNSIAGSFNALEAILDNVGCSIYVTTADASQVLFANKRLQSIFAKELHDGTFQELIEKGMNENSYTGSTEIFHNEKNRWYDLIYKEISWVDGRKAILYSLYDITDKKLYQRKIEQQAYTDFLTGLYNRMCCEKDLARQIDEAKKHNEHGAILYIDLDDFKHINDGLGHQYGDVLLKSISTALKSIDGIRNSCYRMGGDEFVIVIPPMYFLQFERILEAIKSIFAKPWYLKNGDYYCTMSMGVVTFPDSGDSVADLIKKADIAMYEAKKSGKNRIARYKAGKDSVSGRRLDMEKNMRHATVEGYKEFEVFYQPIIDTTDERYECVGAEALIRWNSEELGFIPPTEFIPLAEYLGLINPIGNFVLKEACASCRHWNLSGFPDYKVNVNLSVVQLLQNDIVELIEQTLEETELVPQNLTLEVTESLAINDMERMKDILSRIKKLGVKIALDDFGTGYSSLNHIREIPFDVIKVDQSFVKDLADDAYSQSFVKMVSELARTIGVKVCVEGIETVKQFEALKNMNVNLIQGFYFDRPMEKEGFERKYIYHDLSLEKTFETM